nr:Ser/Thr protein phosphatase family protein [uncultured bacterium]
MIYGVKKVIAWGVRAVRRIFHPTRSWLDIRETDIGIADLPPEFEGYRIAQFSDLHFDGVVTTAARFRELVDAINASKVDLIAFTGDFVTKGIPYRLDDLIPPLRDLHAPDGKVAIMGNHDHRLNTALIRRVIHESGMIDLDNTFYTIQRGDQVLHIAGVDSLLVRQARLDLVLRQLPETGPAILLAHEPDFANVGAATKRFAVQLSGHTHGGQIRIPLLTLLLLRNLNPRFMPRALMAGDMLLYINRGIGTVGLPIRFRCPSELTLITLRAAG